MPTTLIERGSGRSRRDPGRRRGAHRPGRRLRRLSRGAPGWRAVQRLLHDRRLEREAAFLGALSDDRFGVSSPARSPRGRRSERGRAGHPADDDRARRARRDRRRDLPLLRRRHIGGRGRRGGRRCGPAAGAERVARGTLGLVFEPLATAHDAGRRASATTCSCSSTRTAGPTPRPTAPLSRDGRALRARANVVKVQRSRISHSSSRRGCSGGDAVDAAPRGSWPRDARRRRGHDRDGRPRRRHRSAAGHRRRHGRGRRGFGARSSPTGTSTASVARTWRSRTGHRGSAASACGSQR